MEDKRVMKLRNIIKGIIKEEMESENSLSNPFGKKSLSEHGSSEEEAKISAVIAKFPKTFGLRAFPGDTFQISLRNSYIGNNDNIQLYTQILGKNGEWDDFAKGTEDELRREMVKITPQVPAMKGMTPMGFK